MTAYCLNIPYDDYDQPGVHPRSEAIRKWVKGGLPHAVSGDESGCVLKTHKRMIDPGEHKVLYVVRDPRDVMVSLYFHLLRNGEVPYNYCLKDLVIERIDSWAVHIESWVSSADGILRYEDVLGDPVKSLGSAFSTMGFSVAPEVIVDASEVFRFEAMAKRKRGEEDVRSFFRKGVAGDWKNHFDHELAVYCNDAVGYWLEELSYDKQ